MAAAGGTGPIGPYPPAVGDDPAAQEEYDRLRRRALWTFPSGLYVIGSREGERRNGMTANWVPLPYELIGKIANRILNEVRGVNRVVYDISSKPPATIEWE